MIVRFILSLIVGGLLFSAHAEERRVALLIGNQDYPASVGRLTNTHADVSRMADALQAVGFEVTRALDVDDDAMEAALQTFENHITSLQAGGDEVIAFFYYSGHGASMNVDGSMQNFLIPAKENIPNAGALERKGVKVNSLLRGFSYINARAFFVLLDACRNEMSTSFTKSASKGATRVEQRRGMWVAFATSPGATTPDDGLFSTVIAEEIRKPGQRASVSLMDAMTRVASLRSFAGQPIMAPGLLPNDVCFAGCALTEDERDWQRFAALNSAEGYRTYLAFNPNGVHVAEARRRLDDLTPRPTTRQTVSAPDYSDAVWNQISDRDWAELSSKELLVLTLEQVTIQSLLEAADADDGRALRLAGMSHDEGIQVEQNPEKAINYYNQACAVGEASGCSIMGYLHQYAQIVEQDYSIAMDYYQQACDGGYASACGYIGYMYLKGHGVPQDNEQAHEYYKLSCDMSSSWGCYNLGSLYERGIGVSEDFTRANEFFEIACAADRWQACGSLGNNLYLGRGIKKDIERGTELLQKGCADGDDWDCARLDEYKLPRE